MKNNQLSLSVKGSALLVSIALLLASVGCDGDGGAQNEDTGGSMGGVSTAGGADQGGEAPEAGAEAGAEAGEVPPAGAEGGDSGAGAEGGEEPPPPPPPYCPNPVMEPQSSSGSTLPAPGYSAIDDRFDAAVYNLSMEMTGIARPGTYSLEGSTPDDCNVCTFVGYNCTQNGCGAVFFATEGTVTVTEIGDGGGRLTGTLTEAGFMRIGPERTLVEPDEQVCLQELNFDVVIPTLVDNIVPDFKLQNCETGVMENISAKREGLNALLYVATTGWCPYCREFISDLLGGQSAALAAGGVKPMFVVAENDNYEPATVEYCRAYGRRYADTAIDFYVDPSVEKTRANFWVFDEEGGFGYPWTALLNGADATLLYSGPRGPELQSAINEAMSR